MQKFKVSIAIIFALTTMTFAQVADTSTQSGSPNKTIQSSSTQNSPNGNLGKDLAKITPTSKTNWSRVKDLFL